MSVRSPRSSRDGISGHYAAHARPCQRGALRDSCAPVPEAKLPHSLHGVSYYMGSGDLNGDERRIRYELHREGHRRGSRQRAIRRPCRHAVPAGAQRLPAHRPRQVHLPQLRPGCRARRRALPPALRRHQPDQGNRRVRRLDHGRRALARLRLGPAPVLRLRLLRAALRLGRRSSSGRAARTSTTRAPRRCAPPAARSPSRAARARTATGRSRRTSTSSPGCGRASSRTARACCAPRSTWPRRT